MAALFSILKRFPILIILSNSVLFVLICESGRYEMAAIITVVVILFSIWLYKGKTIFVFICFFLIAHSYFSVTDTSDANHLSKHTGKFYSVVGKVVSQPYTDGYQKKFHLQPYTLRNGEVILNIKGQVLTSVDRYAEVTQGEVIQIDGFLEEPMTGDDFNYRLYLRNNGIFALLKSNNISVLEEAPFVESLVVGFRNGIRSEIQQNLPEPHASLLIGMLIGTREEFYDNFSDRLSITGTTHVIAVSGFNVTILIVSILSMSRYFGKRSLLKLSFVAVLIFLGIVGFDNQPALRAGLMGIGMIIAKSIGRRGAIQSSLGYALYLMLLSNPLSIFSISLQLSFAATIGLVVLEPRVKRLVPGIFGQLIKDEFALTLSANLATLPITLNAFGTIPLISPFVNVVVAPLISPIMAVGILSIIVGMFSGTFRLIYLSSWLVLEVFVWVINFFGRLSATMITVSDDKDAFLMFLFGIIFILILLVRPNEDTS